MFSSENLSFDLEAVKKLVRDVPDFPKKGILFKDITPILSHPGALTVLCQAMIKGFTNIDAVFAVESRGFFFGTEISRLLSCALIPVRKKGKLPSKTISEAYSLEYGQATLEVHEDCLSQLKLHHPARILIVDDVLATGGTVLATIRLANRLGAQVIGVACFLEIQALKGAQKISIQDSQISVQSIMQVP